MPTPLSSSTPPSKPNPVEHLLNPTARDTTSVGGRPNDGNGTDSRRTAPIAATSRPATPPPIVMRRLPSEDISLPSITATIDARQTSALLPRDQASALTGSGSLLPSEMMTAPTRPSSRVQNQFVQTEYPASWDSSPPSPLPQLASACEPQSHFAPFTSTGPASTLSQLAFNKKAFDAITSEASHQSQYQFLSFETEQGPIQVPLDVHAASKGADEKRKRNATASHRFRERRKQKDLEISTKITRLEAQLREITEEKEHYQRERDDLQDVLIRHRISIPSRPLSPRRSRHVSLGRPQIPDTEMSA